MTRDDYGHTGHRTTGLRLAPFPGGYNLDRPPVFFQNLVNVPFMRVLDPAARRHVVPALPSRVLTWYLHAPWLSVLTGFVLLYDQYWRESDIVTSNAAKTIFSGMALGLLLFVNVLVFVWPN